MMLVDTKSNKVLKDRLLTPDDALSFIKNSYVTKLNEMEHIIYYVKFKRITKRKVYNNGKVCYN